MIAEMRFEGVSDPDSVATCLQGYDQAVYPPATDWTYTRFFYPQAFDNGFRLVDQSLAVWEAFLRAHALARISAPVEIPMQYFAHAVEIALEASMQLDSPEFQFTPEMWDSAVQESLYIDAVGEMPRGMPSN
jgi:hypothetical protein